MTKDLPTGLVADGCFLDHKTGRWHPECPERFSAALAGVRKRVDQSQLLSIPVREATQEELALGHTESYIQIVRENIMMGRYTLSTGDTDICPQSLDVASHAVGGTLNAVDAVLDGRVKNAFCVLRPPGHHAEPDQGMANDVGVGVGRGFTMNVPLAGGSAREEVVGAFERKLIPAMRELSLALCSFRCYHYNYAETSSR